MDNNIQSSDTGESTQQQSTGKIIVPSPEFVQQVQAAEVSAAQELVTPQTVISPQPLPTPSAEPATLTSTETTQSTPGPIAEETATPLPPSTPVMAASPTGFSARDFEKEERATARKKHLKFFTVTGSLVVTAGVIAAVLFFVVLAPFKTITYDDGVGDRFHLLFYRNYQTGKVADNLPTGQLTKSDPDHIALYSKVWENGKEPLVVSLGTAPYTNENASHLEHNMSCPGLKIGPTIYNKGAKTNVKTCILSNAGTDLVEIAAWKNADTIYAATFFQDLGALRSIGTHPSEATAKAALAKYGIDTYQQDINKILASITPTN